MHSSSTDSLGGDVGVRLSQFVPEARFLSCSDIFIQKCCDDPHRCEPGDVFVVREGLLGQADDSARIALSNGAVAIIAETVIPTGGLPQAIVPNADWTYARLCHALAGDPGRRVRVIAITGTSGKTTTAWLTASVLSEAGLSVGVMSDLGCIDGFGENVEHWAGDDPAHCALWLQRMADSGCSHVVVEVSSRMLASHTLAGLECDTAVLTNIGNAHHERHGSQEAYCDVNGRILNYLAEDGCLIVNGDDSRLQRFVDQCAEERPAAGVIRAGLRHGDITASPVERSLFGQTYLMHVGGHVVPVAVSSPVTSSARNGLLAAAIGVRERIPVEQIARGLETAGCISGRVERLDRGQEFAAFIDTPSTGHALASTLASLRKLTPGHLLLLADEQFAKSLGGWDRFTNRSLRWCDDCLIAPAGIISDDADKSVLAAYARIDRALASLGNGDCVLVLGDVLRGGMPSGGPEGNAVGLVELVDGWLQLSYAPEPINHRRAA